MSPNEIGDKTQAIIMSEFLKKGKVVLMPFGGGQRYDLVIDDNGLFIKIQCKTGWFKEGCVEFPVSNVKDRKTKKRVQYHDIDYFAVYCPELDKTYLIPVKNCPNTFARLRVEKSKNNQSKRVRFAEDYELI